MPQITERGSRQNICSIELRSQLNNNYIVYPKDAEKSKWQLGYDSNNCLDR